MRWFIWFFFNCSFNFVYCGFCVLCVLSDF
nr:MAG TPA: hypothetical protein [Inoviridae sp.]